MPLLPVPYFSQWSDGAQAYRADCGPACVAMLLSYVGKLGSLTIDQLADETGLAGRDVGLSPLQLAILAGAHGVQARVHFETTLDDIRREIDARRPVIVLLAYRFLTGRQDQGDNQPGSDGHFVVAVGYSEENCIILNDSDFWKPKTGHNYTVPVSELDKGMAEYQGQCVFLELDDMPIADQITALITQAELSLDDAKALAAQIVEMPPTDLPGVEMVCTFNLNVRPTPDTTGTPLATLLKGDVVRVQPASPSPWMQITAGLYSGRFVNGAYLAPKA